jgi:hypothetical protein
VVEGVHVATKGPKVRANPLDPNIHHIDPMMFPKSFPIIVFNGLKRVTILANLPKFIGSPNEDSTIHVERIIEVLITSLVTDHDYYFIWFPSTLADSAYAIDPMLKDLSTLGNNSKLHSYAIIDP